MISKALSQIAVNQAVIPWMTCLALVIFLTFFLSMLLWISRKKKLSALPDDGKFATGRYS